MISDEQLLAYNQKGWIPGPEEDEESFCKRVSLGESFYQDPYLFFEERKISPPFPLEKKLIKPRWSWPSSYLFNLFDFAPLRFCAFFHNQDLSLLQGATTWLCEIEKTPFCLIQLRSGLIKGSFLTIYSLEEILAHEAAHAARAAFQEPLFEEFFAYAASSSMLRRFLGPMAGSPKGMLFLGGAILCSILFQWLSFFFHAPFALLSLVFGYGVFAAFSFVLLRLICKHLLFRRAYQKLFRILKTRKKTMATLFRLKDREIKDFSRSSEEEIVDFVKNAESLRWRLLRLAYFGK